MKKYVILLILCFFATSAFGFSDNDYTDEEKEKLAGIEAGAEANEPLVSQSDAEAGTSETEYSWSPLRIAQAIAALASSTSSFLGLSDTPATYTGQGGKAVTVKVDETGLEFTDVGGSGIEETDPAFLLWLSTTPPVMAESDPFFTEWLSTFVDSVGPTYSFGTGLSEVDGHVICTVVPYSDADIDGNESAFTGWDKDSSDDFTWDYDYADLQNTPTIPSGNQIIDWTTDQGETNIHSGNYTDTNTTYSAGTGMSLDGTTFNCTVTDTNTTYTAGDALTLTGTDIDFDGGAAPSGDLGGTWSSPSVSDDSHAHTGTTISGIDISDDTNLAGTANEITLTGDTLSIHSAIARDSELHADESDASTTVKGIIEIADDTEALAGTDTGKAMTPAGVKIYADANDDTGTDDQTAAEVPVTTTAFAGLFANDTSHDTAQELFDLLDDADFGGMTNPMDGAGELIYGGTAGAPTALAKGANNTFLGLDGSGVLGWQSSLSLDDSAAQFYNATDATKKIKLDCSALTSGRTITLSVPDQDTLTLGAGGGTSAGSQYDVQIADASSGFDTVTGEFKYQSNTLYVGTGGISQAKSTGTPGFFTLYSNNSTDTTGAGLKGPSATLANSYHLIFPSTEPALANSIWAHGAASSHNSAGSWLVVGTGNNNLVQLDGSAKLPAVDGSALTNISATPNDTETIYDSDGGTVTISKNNTVAILGATGTVNPITPALGVNLMAQNLPGTTGQITINCPTGCYLGKADGSGYLNQNQDYQSGGANTDKIVYVAIDSTHYICATATGTWTGL